MPSPRPATHPPPPCCCRSLVPCSGDLEEAGYKGFKLIDHYEAGPSVHHTEHHIFRVPKRYAIVNIDELVQKTVAKSQVHDGFIYVASMHTTSSIVIQENSQALLHDIAQRFTDMAPYGVQDYQHNSANNAAAETVDNGDAHIKELLTGNGAQLPITKGKVDIGPDQYIFLAEYDGKKEKRVIMKVTGLRKPAEGAAGAAAGEQKAGPAAAAGTQPTGDKKPFRTYE